MSTIFQGQIQGSLFPGNTKTNIFKKPIQASQMKVINESLTGTQLLAWNILVKHAKEQKAADQSVRTYRIHRQPFEEALGYSSTNKKRLKDNLLKLQSVKVEWDCFNIDNSNEWGSCVLLPYINCKSGVIEYSFVEQIESMLFHSPFYSHLDLEIMKNISTSSAKLLYDWLNRYRTSPSKLSNRGIWQLWKCILQGTHKDEKFLENSDVGKYKIFKRDTLNPAIEEINKSSDLLIQLVEDKDGGRLVKFLQFKVHIKPRMALNNIGYQELLLSQGLSNIDKEFKKLNVSSYYKTKIKKSFSPAIITANIDYTVQRIASSRETILNHGAYLFAACNSNYAGTSNEPIIEAPSDKVDLSKTILEELMLKRTSDADQYFNELAEGERSQLIERYNSNTLNPEEMIPYSHQDRRNRHMIPFYNWLAKETWGAPTPHEIIQYTLQKQV